MSSFDLECFAEASRKLLNKGYIGKEDANVFVEELDNALKEARNFISERFGDNISQEEIQRQLDNIVDMDIVKTSLKIAVTKRATALRELALTSEATRKITTVLDSALELSNESGNIAKSSILKRAINTISEGVNTEQNDYISMFVENGKIKNDDGTVLDLFAYSSTEEGTKAINNFIITNSDEGLNGVGKSVVQSLKMSEEKFDNSIQKVLGKSIKSKDVVNDSIIKSIIKEEKRNFLNKNMKTVGSNVTRFLAGDKFSASSLNMLDQWREYLENFVIAKIIKKDLLDGMNENKIKFIAKDISSKLDSEIQQATVGRFVKPDSYTGKKFTSGLFAYNSYSNYLNDDFIKENVGKYNIDLIDIYQSSINTIARKSSLLKTFGNNPFLTFKNSVSTVKEMGKNANAISYLENELSRRVEEYFRYELGEVEMPEDYMRRGVDASIRFLYSGGLIKVGLAQLGDTGMASISSMAIENDITSGFEFLPKYMYGMGKSILKKMSKSNIYKKAEDLDSIKEVTRAYATSTLDRKKINFLTSSKDKFSKNVAEAYRNQGFTGVLLEGTKPLSFIPAHAEAIDYAFRLNANTLLNKFKNWKEESAYKKSLLTGVGLNKETYNTIVDLVGDKEFKFGEKIEDFIDNLDDEKILETYKKFLENDKGTLIDLATQTAKGRNRFIINEKIGRNGTYGEISDIGKKTLYKEVKDYYSKGNFGYKNWVEKLEEKGIINLKEEDLLSSVIKFETYTGTDMRVQIDQDKFLKLFRDEKTSKEILNYIGFHTQDIDHSLKMLAQNIQQDLNVAYESVIKKDINSYVARVLKNPNKERLEVINFKLESLNNEKIKNITLLNFRNELKSKMETLRETLLKETIKQEPDMWEVPKGMSRQEYVNFRVNNYMKTALFRSTTRLADLIKFSYADIKTNGKEELLIKVVFALSSLASISVWGAISFFLDDASDFELDKLQKIKDESDDKVEVGSKLFLKSTQEGLFFGHGQNPTKAMNSIRQISNGSVKAVYDLKEGEIKNAMIDIGKPVGNAWLTPRVKDLGEGANYIWNYLYEDLFE